MSEAINFTFDVDGENFLSAGQASVQVKQNLRELGLPPGERIGRIKHRLLLRCAVHPEENRREILLKRMHDCI